MVPAPTIALEDVSTELVGVVGGFAGDGVQGVAWLDYDQDGDLDLFHTNSPGRAALLYRNDGDGHFTDVALAAGVAVGTGNSGVLAADLDGDGLTDLMLLGDGHFYVDRPTPAYLFRNRGDGTFDDWTVSSGLRPLLPRTGEFAAAADVDGDGDLDVFVGSPGSLPKLRQDPNALLRNDGAKFVDIGVEAGISAPMGACAGSFLRLDDDPAIDLLVDDCAEVHYWPNPVQVFYADGQGHFVDQRVARQLFGAGWYMAATAGDFDGDGRLDLFSTNEGHSREAENALFFAQADGTYAERAGASGLTGLEFGWGAAAVDLDDDGALDLYYGGTPVVRVPDPNPSPGYALHNDGTGTFTLVPQPFDLSATPCTGLAAADYDDDGWVDLAIAGARHADDRTSSAPILLHNAGRGDGWVRVRLHGNLPNADGVGSIVWGELDDGRRMRRDVVAGSSFLSTESPWPSFGLGDQPRVHLSVDWPDGQVEDFGWFGRGQPVDLTRGDGLVAEPFPIPTVVAARRSGCGSGRAVLVLPLLLVRRRKVSAGAS